ncbi:MAG: hypothetical protein HOQ05_06125 [Corynebacteriales bacterium]|nr:hypothetical protein [Mycobacteriales bacterium]
MRGYLRSLSSITGVLILSLAGCASEAKPPSEQVKPEPPPAKLRPGGQLSSYAVRHGALTYAADYRYTPTGGTPTTARITRTTDSVRFDLSVAGDASTHPHQVSIIQNPAGSFRCIALGAQNACALVGKPGEEFADDPRLERAFMVWLPELSSRSAALSVQSTQGKDALEGVVGECYSVESVTASVEASVDAGTYCFRDDAMISGLRLDSGTLLLVSSAPGPESIPLPGPVVDVLPDVTIPPPASPTPSPTPEQ